ncbi:aromatase/cyclase [Rhodococcoides kyotonense]|uniref:Aromatase n=1 Tax=Rhodococcoides kyotonense TaxID=398843 RepID=A0A239MD79_9NOCA|nr:aromatase/cyclase [Rhodococcus kyotonensis]SNT40093.1 aromatase [Rhodococcus kyotonensis]
MTTNPVHRTSHDIEVQASPDDVYAIIADAQSWPAVFPPTVHVDVLEKQEASERLQIWALANGQVKSWTSKRELDPANYTITFQQQVSAPPVRSMKGQWIVTPSTSGGATVTLTHEFTAVEETDENLAWIDKAIETNSAAELAKLAVAAQQISDRAETVFEFEDSLLIHAEPEAVYEFIDRADLWLDRLDHVARVRFDTTDDGIQELEMDTITPAGDSHTTKSFRIAFPSNRIVYKQTTLPALLAAHTGEWSFQRTDDGVLAASKHVVALRPEAIREVLGADATVDSARTLVKSSLSANSLKTLRTAKGFTETAPVAV